MSYCHQHNRVEPGRAGNDRNFGIRVTLPRGDTFGRILGSEWERVHWYASEGERDRAFDHMATPPGYHRTTDSPTQLLEKIVR